MVGVGGAYKEMESAKEYILYPQHKTKQGRELTSMYADCENVTIRKASKPVTVGNG